MAEYTLVYFNLPGRAELTRLLFAAKDQKFTDERKAFEEWPAYKSKTPFGALPVLIIKDKGSETTICQSGTIARFVAREFGLVGKTNLEQTSVDEVMCCIDDVLEQVFKYMFEKDKAKQAELKKALTETHFLKLKNYLNQRLVQQKTGFLVGNQISLADIAAFNFINQQKEQGDKYFDTETELMQLYEKVKAFGGINAYLDKRSKEKK